MFPRMVDDVMSDAAALARAAEFAAFNGQLEDAQQLLERCTDSLPQEPAAEGAVALARAELAFQRSNYAEAAALADRAATRLLLVGDAEGELRALELHPRVWARHGEEERVQRRCEQLLERWRARTGNEAVEGQVRCLTLITFMHARRFRYEDGIATGSLAVRLARDTARMHSLLPRAANALAGLHFAKACALHPATGWASHITSLAPTDHPDVLEHCRVAMALLGEVRPYSKAGGNQYQDALIGSNMGQLQVLMGAPDAALPDMQRFLDVSRQRQNRYMEADALQAIGWAHLVGGRLPDAQAALMHALGIATSLQAAPLLITIHYDLSTILERAGEVARALHHYREYARLWRRAHQQLAAQPSPHARRRPEPFYLKRAEALIRASLPHSPSAEEIAQHSGASIRAVQLAFREYRGMTPHKYSLALRYQAAHDALASRQAARGIGQICSELGFDDPSRFAREFRKRFGLLPSAFSRDAEPGRNRASAAGGV